MFLLRNDAELKKEFAHHKQIPHNAIELFYPYAPNQNIKGTVYLSLCPAYRVTVTVVLALIVLKAASRIVALDVVSIVMFPFSKDIPFSG